MSDTNFINYMTTNQTNRQNSSKYLYVLLGALTAFAPLVTDMYLPALPAMIGDFHTTMPLVQLGLTFSMVGLAAGQLFFGPLSDKYGRRPLLLLSMAVFILSTVFCIFAPDIHTFVTMRLLQGVGASGGIVISRSIATDKFTGKDLAKAMAIIGGINGIAPVAAPVAGGFFTDLIGWQGIFAILLAIGVVLLFGNLHFRETLPAEARNHDGLKRMALNFGKVMRNPRYVFYVLQFGFANCILFGNIASSPFIMQSHYGFSPLEFSAFFAVNSVAIGAAAALSVKFRRTERSTFLGSVGMLVFSAAEFFTLRASAPFWLYEALLVCLLFSLGLTLTSTTTLAMAQERDNAGTASAIFGAVGFAFGGLVSPIVGLGDMLTTTGIVFAVGSTMSLIFAALATRRQPVSPQS